MFGFWLWNIGWCWGWILGALSIFSIFEHRELLIKVLYVFVLLACWHLFDCFLSRFYDARFGVLCQHRYGFLSRMRFAALLCSGILLLRELFMCINWCQPCSPLFRLLGLSCLIIPFIIYSDYCQWNCYWLFYWYCLLTVFFSFTMVSTYLCNQVMPSTVLCVAE
jgi:hypothetical protein